VFLVGQLLPIFLIFYFTFFLPIRFIKKYLLFNIVTVRDGEYAAKLGALSRGAKSRCALGPADHGPKQHELLDLNFAEPSGALYSSTKCFSSPHREGRSSALLVELLF
jgi:hypothetical protein